MSFPIVHNDQTGNDGRTRAFAASGGPLLPVPGLVKLESVRIGDVEIPLTDKRTMWRQKRGKKAEPIEVDVPMVKAVVLDGQAALARSVYSNHGVWQDGETVYVTGQWTGDESAKGGALDPGGKGNVTKPTRSAYLAMTKGDLVGLARARGLKVPPRAKMGGDEPEPVGKPASLIDLLMHDDATP